MTEVATTFPLLLLLLKGRKQGKILATFTKGLLGYCKRISVVFYLGRMSICSTPCVVTTLGGAVCLQTYIGSIVASVNPYKSIPGLYDRAAVERYSKHHMGEIAPHIFAVANECYRCLWKRHDNQCILIR